MEVFRHPDFDTAFTTHLQLTLHLRTEGFSYSWTDTSDGRLLLLSNHDIRAEKDQHDRILIGELSKLDEVFLPAKTRKVIWGPAPFCLLPSGLSRPEATQQAGMLLPAENRTICLETEGDYQIGFAVPKDTFNRFNDLLPGAGHHHLIEALLRQDSVADTMQVAVDDHLAVLSVYKGGKLQLANSFRFQTVDEFLYFLLLAADQTGFDRESGSLYLTGQVAEDGNLSEEAGKFFYDVSFPRSACWPEEADPVQLPHMFTPMLTLSACG